MELFNEQVVARCLSDVGMRVSRVIYPAADYFAATLPEGGRISP